MQDFAYFRAIAEQLDNGGREALLHHLSTHDLDGFQVRNFPRTAALHEQKLLSMEPDQEWWYRKLLTGTMLPDDDRWSDEIMLRLLIDDYVENSNRHRVSQRSSETKIARFLRHVLPPFRAYRRVAKIDVPAGDGWYKSRQVKAMFYQMPPLNECRDRWERLFGSEEWPEEQGELLSHTTEKEPPF